MQNLNKFEKITGEKVFLRKFALTDAGKIFQMSIEEGMKQWIPDQVYDDINQAREVLEFLIEQYDSEAGPVEVPIVLGVCLNENNELIGHVGLSPVDGGVEIGYAIEESQQRKGYASDAVKTVCNWGKTFYGLEKIAGIVAAENTGSCRVLEKAGFRLLEEKLHSLHGKRRMVKFYRF